MFFAGALFAGEIVVINDKQHNQVYQKGSDLIFPHIELDNKQGKSSYESTNNIKRGIEYLNAVTAYNPNNWAAFWIKGKGYQALKDHMSAYKEFKSSFSIERGNPDVAREFAAACLELGKSAEAIQAIKHAISLSPDDAGMYANLALAYVIEGNNTEAYETINKALAMKPNDNITKAVKNVIEEVINGKRKQPKKIADLY